MKKVVFIIFTFFIFVAIFADDLLKGDIEFYYANDIKNQNLLRRAIILDAEINKAIDDTEIKAVIRAEDDSARVIDSSRIYLREAYINQDLFFNTFISSINFKIGKIIWTWGNADEIKPVDILNPQDYSFLLFKMLNDRKYGLFGGEITVYFGENFNLQLITINEFKPSETESSVFEFVELKKIKKTPGFILTGPVLPDYSKLSNMPYAVRAGVLIYDIDMHVNYFKGYDYTPVLEAAANTLMAVTFTPVHKQIEMIGFDFQRALFSGISVRGEIAYFLTGKYFNVKDSYFMMELLSGGNGLLQKKYTQFSMGFDVVNMFIQDLYFNTQINGNIIADYNEKITNDEFDKAFISTLEYLTLEKKLKLKARGFYNINDSAYALGFELAYKLSGNYDIYAGTWIIEGKEDSYYGQFKDKDMIYVGGKASF
ncbi:MAG: hypothetical protein N3E50_07960 [Candidatus Goldbacteria bacterium]|nr:hypothetical protein [Candidatus Goldiibacteriota bacterium]